MPTDPVIGSQLGDYRLEELIGRGGMGVVYRATDTVLNRPVALKLIAPELAGDERFRERFLRESRLAASLDHPNILPVYGAGEAEGTFWIAMRYVDGEDLRARLGREGKLEAGAAVRILDPIADALDAAHELGLVHRDVKPGNVLLDKRGRPYLSDFGLTKQLSSISGLTATGQIVGTLEYLAPEQIRGDPLDGRADQYALACVLYECLAGHSPFERETEAQLLWAHMHEEPPSLADPTVDAAVRRGLAKDRARRYSTCGALVDAARPIGAVAARRRPRRLLAAAVAVVGLAVVAAVGLALAFRGGGPPPTVVPNSLVRIDARTGKITDVVRVGKFPYDAVAAPKAIWVSNVAGSSLSRTSLDGGGVETFTSVPAPAGIAIAGNDLWAVSQTQDSLYRLDVGTGELVDKIPLRDARPTDVAVGGGSLWVTSAPFFTTSNNRVSRIDLRSSRVIARPLVGRGPISIAFGAGAAWVANTTVGTVSRIEAKTGNVRTIDLRSRPFGLAVGYGAIWVAGPAKNVVWRINAVTGGIDAVIPVSGEPVFVATGAGAVWATGHADGTVSHIDPATNQVVKRIRVGFHLNGLAVTQGGVWVAAACGESRGSLEKGPCPEWLPDFP